MKRHSNALTTPLAEREKGDVKKAFCETMISLARARDDIIALDADLMKCSGIIPFAQEFPDRHFQMGVSEQNMIGVAAGMAISGFVPFASSFANFASKRACDQASISVGYNRANVKICGDYAGLTTEKNGGSHCAVEDIAIFRSMPDFVVIAPADTIELRAAMRAIAEYDGPVYLRKVRGPLPQIFDDDYKFEIGKGAWLREGKDVTLAGTGVMTWHCLLAAEALAEAGVDAAVLSLPTIKPLDVEILEEAARETGAIVTVENHNIIGGLGGAVAETLSERSRVPVKRIGIPDQYGETGSFAWQLEHFGLSVKHIVEAGKALAGKK